MKADVANYVKTCHECQMVKSKYKPCGNRMVLPEYSTIPFEVIHLDFAELKKKGEGVRRTQAFLVAVDECTRFVAAKAGREDANCVISLLERDIFKNTKVIVADNGPAFRSEKLRKWASEKNIAIRYPAPYHPEANSLAERMIRDLKMFIKLYPEFKGGWKNALEAAVLHHNRSYTAGIGCSPHFAAFGTIPWLPADRELGLVDRINLKEQPKTQLQRQKYRMTMKMHFDRRHKTKMPEIDPGSMVLVRKGLDSKTPFTGPYFVVKTAKQQGLLKTIYYNGPSGRIEEASVGNVLPYYHRQGNDSRPGECSDPHRQWPRSRKVEEDDEEEKPA